MYTQQYVRLAWLLFVLCIVATLSAPSAAGQAVHDLESQTVATVGVDDGAFVGSDIVVSALDNKQYWPAVAYNPQQREYLVVWQNTWGGNRDIYAQRINKRGDLLSWFAVTTGSTDRAQPSVAYDPVNRRYLITWVEDINGDDSDWDVRGRFFGWDGPDPSFQEFSICDWTTKQWNPKVAYARTQGEFLVIWWTEQQGGVNSYVSGRRINATTRVPNGNPFAIASHGSQERVAPAIAYNLSRNEYLITYHNGLDIFGTRLRGDGTILSGGEFSIAGWPSTEMNPSIASCIGTDQYLVAWQAKETGGQYNIYVRFVLGDGSPDSVHRLFPYPVHEQHPHVACSGSQYLVTWEHQYSNITGPYGIWGRMIATNASMLEPITLVAPAVGVSAEFSRPVAAGGHSHFLAAWEHDRGNTIFQDIHARMMVPHMVYLPMSMR